MDRKSFLKYLGGSIALVSVIEFLDSCHKSNTVPSAPSEDFTLDLSLPANVVLLQSGGALISNQVIIINNNGNYIALSDICTHQGCSVGYDNSGKQIICPCHGATYSLSGAVTGGPAPSALKQYNITKNGNILHISG